MIAYEPAANRLIVKRRRTLPPSFPVASFSVNLNLDICTDYISSAEEVIEIESIKADYSVKLNSGFYDNDASNPANSVFIKDGDLKTEMQGVDRSNITGSELVFENSQTFIECTQNECFEKSTYVNKSDTWKVPEAKFAYTDHIARAVIKFISNLV